MQICPSHTCVEIFKVSHIPFIYSNIYSKHALPVIAWNVKALLSRVIHDCFGIKSKNVMHFPLIRHSGEKHGKLFNLSQVTFFLTY